MAMLLRSYKICKFLVVKLLVHLAFSLYILIKKNATRHEHEQLSPLEVNVPRLSDDWF